MLYTSVVTLCLVCFLHCFEPVQCRSTGHLNEYSNRSSLTRRCLQSCFLISGHQTCFEKCLGKNKEGDFTYLNARIQRINPPHLTPTFKRRKRSTEESGIPCPRETKGNNSFPTLRTPERNQYENSRKWYLNISWNSLPDSSNFTGYGIAYVCTSDEVFEESFLEMPKNETFKIFNETESCWSYDMDFYFLVLGLPCLNGEFTFEDLLWPERPTGTKVLQKVLVIGHLESLTVLPCAVVGFTIREIEWSRIPSSPLPPGRSSVENGHLIIRNTEDSDKGIYKCTGKTEHRIIIQHIELDLKSDVATPKGTFNDELPLDFFRRQLSLNLILFVLGIILPEGTTKSPPTDHTVESLQERVG